MIRRRGQDGAGAHRVSTGRRDDGVREVSPALAEITGRWGGRQGSPLRKGTCRGGWRGGGPGENRRKLPFAVSETPGGFGSPRGVCSERRRKDSEQNVCLVGSCGQSTQDAVDGAPSCRPPPGSLEDPAAAPGSALCPPTPDLSFRWRPEVSPELAHGESPSP